MLQLANEEILAEITIAVARVSGCVCVCCLDMLDLAHSDEARANDANMINTPMFLAPKVPSLLHPLPHPHPHSYSSFLFIIFDIFKRVSSQQSHPSTPHLYIPHLPFLFPLFPPSNNPQPPMSEFRHGSISAPTENTLAYPEKPIQRSVMPDQTSAIRIIQPANGNPGPLGLFAFAVTTSKHPFLPLPRLQSTVIIS